MYKKQLLTELNQPEFDLSCNLDKAVTVVYR